MPKLATPPLRDEVTAASSRGNLFSGQTTQIINEVWQRWFSSLTDFVNKLRADNDFLPRHSYFSNPHFLIDQVNEGTAYTVNTTNVACMDGVRANVIDNAGSGAFTVERATHPTDASLKSCKIICTVVNTTIAAGDYAEVEFRIPGNECLDLKLGTLKAQSIAVQFEYQSNVLGIYGVSITNSAGNRSYATTINVESTDNKVYPIPIPMDTTGTWLYTSGVGFTLRITLNSGSTYQGALNTWSASNVLTSSAQANFLSVATTNICYLSELHIVKGAVVGEMPVADYTESLQRCERQLTRIPFIVRSEGIASAFNWIPTQTTMLATPTPTLSSVTYVNGSGGTTQNANTKGAEVSFAASAANGYMAATLQLDGRL